MEERAAIEQEINKLEEVLREKKAELEATRGEAELPPEKEMLREVIGQQIEQQAASSQPAPIIDDSSAPGDDQVNTDDQSWDMDTAVQGLVQTVFSAGLQNGINQALKTNNPALIDAFHDTLVDELYDELVSRRIVQPPQ